MQMARSIRPRKVIGQLAFQLIDDLLGEHKSDSITWEVGNKLNSSRLRAALQSLHYDGLEKPLTEYLEEHDYR